MTPKEKLHDAIESGLRAYFGSFLAEAVLDDAADYIHHAVFRPGVNLKVTHDCPD